MCLNVLCKDGKLVCDCYEEKIAEEMHDVGATGGAGDIGSEPNYHKVGRSQELFSNGPILQLPR